MQRGIAVDMDAQGLEMRNIDLLDGADELLKDSGEM